MLLATRRASQLFHSLFPVPRMGDSASKIVSPQEALPGRKEPIPVAAKHHVNGNRTVEPFPEGTQMAVFGMGCFWGAERKFWTIKGVYSTQVGYAGGYTSNPTYKEVCSGKTGHAEVVRVVYQPERISFEELLKVFWENHDPTQGSFGARLWAYHDRHPGAADFLLRRGLPPAVPEQEPRWVLWPGGHRRVLPTGY
ncbi:mitochondrial peptide methionine sulfoxide reductase isoform X3 [Suricata suricatta]|uniref:mitochondrial peptide methionine sulfoxide reductase isoform X3 n=1 Tax=Suricata suricatta TaxID=37032 RepID=UPI001155A962|nr:mitochondrial peptide methionine sulfoxide reductase isoform X3 [Suricata suricatta]